MKYKNTSQTQNQFQKYRKVYRSPLVNVKYENISDFKNVRI